MKLSYEGGRGAFPEGSSRNRRGRLPSAREGSAKSLVIMGDLYREEAHSG